MRVILAAIALSVAVALVAGAGFYLAQEPVYQAQPGPGVRVGDPGHNLVGQHWTGNPTVNGNPRGDGESAKAETKDDG